MALTRAGANLTDAHRRRQIRLALRADADIRQAWKLLDLADIDGTRVRWAQQVSGIIHHYYDRSQATAATYLSTYRMAEIGHPGGSMVVPAFNRHATATALDLAGPVALKKHIATGMAPRSAYQYVRGQMVAASHKAIMAGGRGLLTSTGRADKVAIGWRRVADRDPCTFCAMLVSRGPAYTSEAAALSRADTDDPYHEHCKCTVEIVYGDWLPNDFEQVWVDAYYDAAEAANQAGENRTAQTVLWRMRENGAFRDSPARRSAH